jgi:arsenite methyltransferase
VTAVCPVELDVAVPIEDASVDLVISNGVLNLAPDKRRVLAEVVRVLEPGGRLQLSKVTVRRGFSPGVRSNPELWAACIGGALPEREILAAFAEVGRVEGRVTGRFESFRYTSAEEKVRKDMRIRGSSFLAYEPRAEGSSP